jgi:flagellar hook-associated protein 1 FlgK
MAGDLLSILSQAGTSLGAHREAVATASQNISNVNTPGYSRQTVNLEALTPADLQGGAYVGRGVGVQSITQARDQFIERQIPNAMASQSWSSTASAALASVSALDPNAAGGLSSALSDFYSALRDVAQNPSDPATRQEAAGATQALARSFNRTSQALEDARSGLDQQIAGNIQDINDAAANMAALNKQIRIASASGAQPNDLLDARRQLQDKLTQLTGATPIVNAQGDVSMALPGGTALVSDDRAAQLSTIADPNNRGHLALQLTRSDGSGPVALGAAGIGGALGGAIDARDNALGAASASVDQLAFDMANTVNAVSSAGYALDGTTGHAMFTVGATALGAAQQIAIDPTLAANPSLLAAASSAAGLQGDNQNLLALIATERTALAGGKSPEDTFSTIVSQFGGATQRSKAMADQDGALLDNLNQMRESTSGVSLDEEMINLTSAQRAFEAVSKVVTATGDMLDTLMALK